MHQLRRSQLMDIAERMDLDEDSVRTDYSGRGMYGKSCAGFVVSSRQVVSLGAAIASVLAWDAVSDASDDTPEGVENTVDAALSLALDLTSGAQMDTMGRDFIVYFPRLVVIDD